MQAKAELTKARARAIGAKLFAEKGYAETTTRELATAMNVTNGTFYYYFASKEDLLYEISIEALVEITAAVQQTLEAHEGPEVRLRAMIATHMESILGSPDSHKMALEQNWRALTEEKRAKVVAARGIYEGLFRSEIQAAQEAGLLRRNTSSRVQMLLLLNMMNWTIFWYRPGGDLSVDEVILHVQQMFFDGTRA
jgi:AcrR family transcriptional regulator